VTYKFCEILNYVILVLANKYIVHDADLRNNIRNWFYTLLAEQK